MPGVEKIAWLEIRDRLPTADFVMELFAKDQNGIVVFDYEGAIDDLLQLRTTEDLFLQALHQPKLSRGRQDLRQIVEWVWQGEDFGRATNELMRHLRPSRPPHYRVIARKYGRHQYRRRDVGDAVREGMSRRLPRWTPVPEAAQVEVWVNVLGSQLLIGYRLSSRRMRHRHRKAVQLPASLRPSVAAAMVYLTEPAAGDRFLDPMCGSGTMLLERRAAGPAALLLAGDLASEPVRATRKNLARRRGRPLPALQWDATRLPLPAGSIHKIAANLPFGRQIAVAEALPALYRAFFGEADRVLTENGRAVILSSEYELVKEMIRPYPHLHIVTGYSIAVLGTWGRIYLIERPS
jgi:predicted RNA methylase